MSQCVPSWTVDNNIRSAPTASLRSKSNSTLPDIPMLELDYEVAELTWQNGQLTMNGMGLPRLPAKPITASAVIPSASHHRASGTLESIVNQATRFHHRSKSITGGVGDKLVPWFDPRRAAAASNTVTMDALVPCSHRTDERSTGITEDSIGRGIGTCVMGCSTRVGSCGGAAAQNGDTCFAVRGTGAARVPVGREWRSRDQSVSGRDSHHVPHACDGEFDVGCASTSTDSPENTVADDHDSVCHSTQREEGYEADKKKRTVKSSGSVKRRRAADVHNQSERKRRDKINQRMKTLQKLVPNSSYKTDKASMLDEVIEYLKQLQAQVQMMSRMSLSSMMLPMTMQQQLQMPIMAPIGMGLGMSLGMDMNTMARPNIPTIPPMLHPATAFMPMAPWDASGAGDRLQGAPPMTAMPDRMSTFLACQSQAMNMDAYSRIAAMYQQLQQASASSSKS